MTEDDAAKLDDLLCRWAQWCRPVRVGRGFADRSLVTGQYRTRRQYDDENGALEEGIEHTIMKAVDAEVFKLADPWRSAIHTHARNLVVGFEVFLSPRLPQSREERAALVLVARGMLWRGLELAGVV